MKLFFKSIEFAVVSQSRLVCCPCCGVLFGRCTKLITGNWENLGAVPSGAKVGRRVSAQIGTSETPPPTPPPSTRMASGWDHHFGFLKCQGPWPLGALLCSWSLRLRGDLPSIWILMTKAFVHQGKAPGAGIGFWCGDPGDLFQWWALSHWFHIGVVLLTKTIKSV